MALIVTLVEEDNDAILVELCERLEERTGIIWGQIGLFVSLFS